MNKGYLELQHNEMFGLLYNNSPVSDRIESIRRRLASVQCKGDEATFLKGELVGLLEVPAMVEALATGKDVSGTNEGPTAHTKRLLEFAGFRDRFSARAS